MIYIIVLSILIALAFFANFLYKAIVLRDTQESQIVRASKRHNAYDVASFGSSYARYAFDFSNTTLNGYNFGLMPQFLYYTDKMIRDYRKSYKDNALILIVLPGLVFGCSGKGKHGADRYAKLLSKKAQGDEYDLKKHLFVKLFPLLKPSPYNLKTCIKTALNFKRIASDYETQANSLTEHEVINQAKIRCNDWIKEFHLIDTQSDQIPECLENEFKKSRDILTSMIDYCLSERLRPVLVVTPVSKQMKDMLSDAFLEKVLYNNIKKANKANVPFLDYMTDTRFTDFIHYNNNSDFLNATARKTFSQIVIDDALKAYEKYDR